MEKGPKNHSWLKAEFKNNLHNSYMVLKAADHCFAENYQIRMIMNNEIMNLLRLNYNSFDGEVQYYYDVTDLQVLSKYLDRWGLNYDLVFQLLKSLSIVSNELKAYLLDPDHLLIDQDYIFFDETKESFSFCFHKDYKNSVVENLHELAGLFMNRRIEDEKGSLLVKELYSKSRDENFSIDKILDLASGKYYEQKNISFNLKESLSNIHSRMYEEEISRELGQEDGRKGLRKKLESLRAWFNDINDKIHRR